MPTYEYQCSRCGLHFEKQQPMNDEPLSVCPDCEGSVKRLVSGGTGFMMKGKTGRLQASGGCSLEEAGRTCCGAASRCGNSNCGD
ncbi:MAG TPA: zinc ribbon domain-containing protein [Smithellaceae bacterium]|nr:zinc ribbon domain-containing protein [Smithellaceae bacterium]